MRIFDWGRSELLSKEAFEALAKENIGEADLKIYRVAQLLAPAHSVVLKTVDTDVILQAVATPDPPVVDGSFTLALKDFEVDANALIKAFQGKDPDTRVETRLETAFWWIMAGGTDYSKPASDQGFAKKALLDLTHPRHPLRTKCLLFSKSAGGWRFHPALALKKLQGLPKTRKVSRDLAGKAKRSGRSVADAVREALVCTAYYGLINVRPPKNLYKGQIVMSPAAEPVDVVPTL